MKGHPLLNGAFVSIDGLNLPVQNSDDEDIENATFNGWLHNHFVSSVLVFLPKGQLTSMHASFELLLTYYYNVIRNCYSSKPQCTWKLARCVSSTAYLWETSHQYTSWFLPCSWHCFPMWDKPDLWVHPSSIKGGPTTPRNSWGDWSKDGIWSRNSILLSDCRVGNCGLQGSFGWLRVPLEINHVECRGDLLETCVRSFNLCARQVGMNQIRNVYMPLWQHDTNEEVWHNFKSMLFSDQRKNDQVARFHTYAEYN
jgi:hypothetical protein